MKLGIVGSRRRNTEEDKKLIKAAILISAPDMLISGGCPKGADRFAEELARELNIPIRIYHPEVTGLRSKWDFTKAYYERNKKIAEKSDYLVALVVPDRKGGTEYTIKEFLKLKNEKRLKIL